MSRVKYLASRPLSPKTYWYLMGKLKPAAAVTSEHAKLEDSLASGENVVALLAGMGVLGGDAVTLHIGSGIGRVEYHLRHHVRRCYGVDVSPSMVQHAARLVPFDDVEFRCTDGRGLDGFADETFDLVYSFLVFQHLPRDQFHRYVRAAYAKLTQGGTFLFQIMIDETGSHPEPPPEHPYGLRHYRRSDVEETLRGTGFSPVSRWTLAGHPDPGSPVATDVVFRATKP